MRRGVQSTTARLQGRPIKKRDAWAEEAARLRADKLLSARKQKATEERLKPKQTYLEEKTPLIKFSSCVNGACDTGDVNHATWFRIYRVGSLVSTAGVNAEIENPKAGYNYYVHTGTRWLGHTAIEWSLGLSMFAVLGYGAYSEYARIEEERRLLSIDYLAEQLDKICDNPPSKTVDEKAARNEEVANKLAAVTSDLWMRYLHKGFISPSKINKTVEDQLNWGNSPVARFLLELENSKNLAVKVFVNIKNYLIPTTAIFWPVWMTVAYFSGIPAANALPQSLWITLGSMFLGGAFLGIQKYLTPKEPEPSADSLPQTDAEKEIQQRENELNEQIAAEKHLHVFLNERYRVFVEKLNNILAQAPASATNDIKAIFESKQTVQPKSATGMARSLLSYTTWGKIKKAGHYIFESAWGIFTLGLFVQWLLIFMGISAAFCLALVPGAIPILTAGITAIATAIPFLAPMCASAIAFVSSALTAIGASSTAMTAISVFFSDPIYSLVIAGSFGILQGLFTYANQVKDQLKYDLTVDERLNANCLVVQSPKKFTNEKAFDYLYAQVEELKLVVEKIQAIVRAEYADSPPGTEISELDALILAFNCSAANVTNEALFTELQEQTSAAAERQNTLTSAYKVANGSQTAFFHVRNFGLSGGVFAERLANAGKALFTNAGPMKLFLGIGFIAAIAGGLQKLFFFQNHQDNVRKERMLNTIDVRIKYLQQTADQLSYIEKLYYARDLIDPPLKAEPAAQQKPVVKPASTPAQSHAHTRSPSPANHESLSKNAAALYGRKHREPLQQHARARNSRRCLI